MPFVYESIEVKKLQTTGYRTVYESMNTIPGVRTQTICSVCNTGELQINGMSGIYNLVMIDEMPMLTGLSSIYGIQGLPNFILQRVDITKSIGEARYPSDAMGGLIHLHTINPYLYPYQVVSETQQSSYGDINQDLAIFIGSKKKTNAFVFLNYNGLQTIHDVNDDGIIDIPLSSRVSVGSKINISNQKRKLFSFYTRYYHELRTSGELDFKHHTRGNDSIYGEDIITHRAEFASLYRILSKENLQLKTSFSYHYQNSFYGTTLFLANEVSLFNQLEYKKKLFKKIDSEFGITSRYHWFDDNTPATQNIDSTNNPAASYAIGAYVDLRTDIKKMLFFQLGLRYDYDIIHQHIFTPRLAIQFYKKNWDIKLNVGRGYRPMRILTEDHAAISGSRKLIIEPNIKPEESINSLIQITKHFEGENHHIDLEASLFYNYFFRKVIADYVTDPNAIIYKNANNNAHYRGFSFTFRYDYKTNLKLSTSIHYLNAMNTLNDSLQRTLFAPEWSFYNTISYENHTYKFKIGLNQQIYSPMRLPILPNDFRSEYSPWYSLAGVMLEKNFDNIDISLNVNNLFNFIPSNPIMRPFDPFDQNIHVNNPNNYTFDTSYGYASMRGVNLLVGVRWKL